MGEVIEANISINKDTKNILIDNSNELKTIWANISQKLREIIPAQFFDIFFTDMKLLSLKENSIVFSVGDKKIKDHINKRYNGAIKNAIRTILKKEINVKIIDAESDEFEQTSFINKNENTYKESQAKKTINEYGANSIHKENDYPKLINLNPNYTFEKYIKGPSNEHAYMAALGAAENPTKFHNPLYIFGGVSLGKTHLLMSVGNYINENMPHLKVQYTPADVFQSDLVEAVAKKNLPSFRAKYRSADILMFDDIQSIKQRAEYTQEEIFHTFNYLYQNKKQIIISADRPAQLLSNLTDRLLTRFQSGLLVDIKPPGLETRMAIIKLKAEQMNVEIPYDVQSYIANQIKTQVRMLEAALIKLKFVSEIEKKNISLGMAKTALKDMVHEIEGNNTNVEDIIKVIAKNFHINEEDITGSSRVEAVALARHVGMFITKKLVSNMSLISIANAYGRNDHTTVIHAEKKVRDLIDKDESLRIQVNEMIEELQS
ncbi:MAG: chromosomal replication initiator protein DnaA [Spirochaetia bacterium]|nr:chromosomal replication initiator protein DnaA [Spirochaetia bacterium]